MSVGPMATDPTPPNRPQTDADPPRPALPGVRPRRAIPRYMSALVVIVAIQVIIFVALGPTLQQPLRTNVSFSGFWEVSGCVQNATYSVPLNYTNRFANVDGPDAYVVVGLYVNHVLRKVSTTFVPKGAWGLMASGSEPVNCATFRTAALAVISTVAA